MGDAGQDASPVIEREAMVEMAEGVSLSVGLRIPASAHSGEEPAPVVLDCHPYRKDDLFSFRGSGLYEGLNARGFATARLDVRGTGRSRGSTPPSEYSEIEITDAVAVIAWLAAQPWCNGSVGMWGISWSAINALLVAARRPPALKACIALHPSDELFASDIHFIDGLLHYDLYELSIDLLNSIGPGPEFDLSETVLQDRFDQPPWMGRWLAHQTNDGFWRERSLAPRWERIACPVFLVGGWYDGYHECVFRLLDHLEVPVQACVGPWSHTVPNMGGPGAPADWIAQACDWWDRWLRVGESEAPPERWRRVQLFARDWHPPAPACDSIPGSWRALEAWPLPGMTEAAYRLAPGALVEAGGGGAAAEAVVIDSPPWIGSEVGHWWGDVAFDQAPLDADCAVFDSGELADMLETLGAPRLRARLSSPGGVHLFARLEDVSPEGSVTLVTGAGLALAEGEAEVELALHWTSWRFAPGHRLRLGLSTALWPMFWPARRSGPLELSLSKATLVLPVPPAGWGREGAPPEVPPAEDALGSAAGYLRPVPVWDLQERNGQASFTWSTHGEADLGFARIDSLARLDYAVNGQPEIDASAEGEAVMDVTVSGRRLTWRIATRLESEGGEYRYRFRRELYDGGQRRRRRTWSYEIPRHRV